MSEEKLKAAFESMRPDDAARQRMLNNILKAHEERLQTDVTDAPVVPKKHRSSKQFSLIRYVLPIAACLILAVVLPLNLPQLVTTTPLYSDASPASAEDQSSHDSHDSETEDTAEAPTANNADDDDENTSDAANAQPPTDSVPTISVETPMAAASDPTLTFAQIITIVCIAIPCIAALVFAVVGLTAWRRAKKT